MEGRDDRRRPAEGRGLVVDQVRLAAGGDGQQGPHAGDQGERPVQHRMMARVGHVDDGQPPGHQRLVDGGLIVSQRPVFRPAPVLAHDQGGHPGRACVDGDDASFADPIGPATRCGKNER